MNPLVPPAAAAAVCPPETRWLIITNGDNEYAEDFMQKARASCCALACTPARTLPSACFCGASLLLRGAGLGAPCLGDPSRQPARAARRSRQSACRRWRAQSCVPSPCAPTRVLQVIQAGDTDIVAFDFYSRFQRPTAPACERFAAWPNRPNCKRNRLKWWVGTAIVEPSKPGSACAGVVSTA